MRFLRRSKVVHDDRPVEEMSQAEASAELEVIRKDALAHREVPSLRRRLDLYYKATGTSPADYEDEDDDGQDDE